MVHSMNARGALREKISARLGVIKCGKIKLTSKKLGHVSIVL